MRIVSLPDANLVTAAFACLVTVTWTAACAHEMAPRVAATGEGARPDAAESAARSSPVDPSADASSTNDEITLSCRLIDARTKRGVSGVRVVASLVTYPDPPTPDARRRMQKTVLSDCVSAEGGSFTVDVDLAAFATSRCLIAAWSKDWAGYYDFLINEVQGDGQLDTSLDVPVYPRTGSLRLRTVNRLGRRVPGCAVVVLPAWEDWQGIHAWITWPVLECEDLISALGLLATSGPNGEITIDHVPVHEDPHAGYFAYAFDQRHASRREWFEEPIRPNGKSRVVKLPVEPIASLSLAGVCVNENGDVIPGVSVYVNGAQVAQAAQDGSWRVDGSQVGVGPWTFSFRAVGYKELSFVWNQPQCFLHEDAANARLTMETERR